MTEVAARVDLVAVAASDLCAGQVALGDQVGDDALGGALGDANLSGDVPSAAVRIASNAQQHVCMVAQEDPRAFLFVGLRDRDMPFTTIKARNTSRMIVCPSLSPFLVERRVTLKCSHCRLSIRPRFAVIAPEYCPRCLARGRIVALETEPQASESIGASGARSGPPRPSARVSWGVQPDHG